MEFSDLNTRAQGLCIGLMEHCPTNAPASTYAEYAELIEKHPLFKDWEYRRLLSLGLRLLYEEHKRAVKGEHDG